MVRFSGFSSTQERRCYTRNVAYRLNHFWRWYCSPSFIVCQCCTRYTNFLGKLTLRKFTPQEFDPSAQHSAVIHILCLIFAHSLCIHCTSCVSIAWIALDVKDRCRNPIRVEGQKDHSPGLGADT